MSDLKTIAYPYAKAAFDFAKEQRALPEWHLMIAIAVEVMEQPEVAVQVSDLQQGGKAEYQAFLKFLFSVGEGLLDEYAQNLIKVMAENRRLSAMREVLSEFTALKNEDDKVIDVEVTSSDPLSTEQLALLTKSLEIKFNRHVTLTTRLDTALVGGIVIKAGEIVIDGSLKSSIKRLSTSLHM
ncbi:F0F1 ATP synthase subunit delta [Vibrio profundum]|uniref:F0F1 ATP synthase subunit delta n=1 Tax=Vibrio profundum TaxID=2910247 RepID=UPI003D101E0E